jgi:hypothetical protein
METRKEEGKGVTANVIEEFDRFLEVRGLNFQGIVVGAAPLILLEIIDRRTMDCDVLDPRIPVDVNKASVEFARQKSESGYDLPDGWFNNGPASLKGVLPDGWRERISVVYEGRALTLHTLGRMDLLGAKLFGYCDRGTDLEDCIALSPSMEELEDVIVWVKEQDGNPRWPAHVEDQFRFLEERLRIHTE